MYKFTLYLLLGFTFCLNAQAEEPWQEKLMAFSNQALNKYNEYKKLTVEESFNKIRQELAQMDKEQLQSFIAQAKTYLKNFDEKDQEALLNTAKLYLQKAEQGLLHIKSYRDKQLQEQN